MKLTKFLAVTAVAGGLVPLTAEAVTVVDGVSPGTYSVPGNYSSTVMFTNGDPANSLTWTFENTGSANQVIAVAFATVLQAGGNAFFTDGATFSLGGNSFPISQGQAAAFNDVTATVAPGASIDLVFNYGTVFEKPGQDVTFDYDLTATAIPLPASVLMLLGALGGLGVLSRRRTASA